MRCRFVKGDVIVDSIGRKYLVRGVIEAFGKEVPDLMLMDYNEKEFRLVHSAHPEETPAPRSTLVGHMEEELYDMTESDRLKLNVEHQGGERFFEWPFHKVHGIHTYHTAEGHALKMKHNPIFDGPLK